MPDSGAESQTIAGSQQQAASDAAAQIASAFHKTNSSKKGLSSDEATRRLAQYGPNALEDRTESTGLLLYNAAVGFWQASGISFCPISGVRCRF